MAKSKIPRDTSGLYNAYFDMSENAYLYFRNRAKYFMITLNGQGSSGKTSVAKKLEADDFGYLVNVYRTRDGFQRKLYDTLQRTHEQRNVEVFGIPSFAWMGLEFHYRIKPFLNAGQMIICDHYLGDYYADMLEDLEDIALLKTCVTHIGMPWFTKTLSFYLDIDYETYIKRHESREHLLPENTEVAKKNFVPEDLFDARKKRYQKLVDLGLLKKIDATKDVDKVYLEVKKAVIHAQESYQKHLDNDA